ncbi:hypothetical protein Anapl_13866 [Anas platyrhynchos]|uniref:Uncharacterized protein n=1 Tax=Anas platyrhynchos TaxID=8839 RepID=R0LWT1_ANAPL|nr:hypothetical protein Anapl_13866 [Anas platyrhynchos]
MLTESENRDSRKVMMPTSSLLYGQLAVPYTFCNKGLQCESYKTLVHLEVLCLPHPALVLGIRISVGHAEEVCVEDERAAEWAVKENYALIIEKRTGLSLGSQSAGSHLGTAAIWSTRHLQSPTGEGAELLQPPPPPHWPPTHSPSLDLLPSTEKAIGECVATIPSSAKTPNSKTGLLGSCWMASLGSATATCMLPARAALVVMPVGQPQHPSALAHQSTIDLKILEIINALWLLLETSGGVAICWVLQYPAPPTSFLQDCAFRLQREGRLQVTFRTTPANTGVGKENKGKKANPKASSLHKQQEETEAGLFNDSVSPPATPGLPSPQLVVASCCRPWHGSPEGHLGGHAQAIEGRGFQAMPKLIFLPSSKFMYPVGHLLLPKAKRSWLAAALYGKPQKIGSSCCPEEKGGRKNTLQCRLIAHQKKCLYFRQALKKLQQYTKSSGRFCSPKHLDKTYTSTEHRTVVRPAPALGCGPLLQAVPSVPLSHHL